MLKNRVSAFSLYLVLFALGTFLFYDLRSYAIQSGDWEQYVKDLRYNPSTPIFHVREPGAVLIWEVVAYMCADMRHFETAERLTVFSVVDAVAGGMYLVFLVAFLRMLGIKGRISMLLGAGVVLISAVTWVFVGHAEFYAPLYAALMAYYTCCARYWLSRKQGDFYLVILAAAIAATMHRVAVFHMPALLLAFRTDQGWRKPTRNEVAAIVSGILLVCVPTVLIVTLAGTGSLHWMVFEDYNWLPELLTPFTQRWADYVRAHSRLGSYHLFTFGSLAHWKHFSFFVAAGAPVGLLVLLARARRGMTGFERFLLMSAVCGWIWALFWHPHMSYGDWDLFCNPAIPTNLLAASLLCRFMDYARQNGSEV